MKAELTKAENNLLTQLVKDFESKVAKSKKLSEEHQLILALTQKSVLSEADVKKLKSLLAFEQSKIIAREKKRQAKEVLKNHESEKKEIIENRYKRFGLVTIESLKKLSDKKTIISLSDFLLMMLDDGNLNEKDKEWLGNFLQDTRKDNESENERNFIGSHAVINHNSDVMSDDNTTMNMTNVASSIQSSSS